jgi:hypothetical protein
MSKNTGRFVWFELFSDAATEAARFYAEVLPWTVEAMPMPGGDYSMIKAGDAGVGGFAPLPAPGVSPHWVSYLAVEDVDAAVAAVKKAGGKVLMDAIDVPGVGRMQPVKDPAGGAFFVFRGEGEESGPTTTGPGTFHWNELWTRDPAKTVTFYEKVFGFTHSEMEMPEGTYFVLEHGGVPRAGVMAAPDPRAPVQWVPYVEVADTDAAAQRATRGGATLLGELADVPDVGRIGLIRDPFGGTLGLIKPAPRAE